MGVGLFSLVTNEPIGLFHVAAGNPGNLSCEIILYFSPSYKNSVVNSTHFVQIIQGRPSQNGFFQFDFLEPSTGVPLVYLASNQQLLMDI